MSLTSHCMLVILNRASNAFWTENTKKNILRVSYILCSAEINLSARGPIYFCTERSDLYEWIQEQIEYLTKHCIAYVKIDHQLIMRRNITILRNTLVSQSINHTKGCLARDTNLIPSEVAQWSSDHHYTPIFWVLLPSPRHSEV